MTVGKDQGLCNPNQCPNVITDFIDSFRASESSGLILFARVYFYGSPSVHVGFSGFCGFFPPLKSDQ